MQDHSNSQIEEPQGYLGYVVQMLANAHIFDLVKIALLCYFFLLLILTVFGKSKEKGRRNLPNSSKNIPTRERLLRRFLFAQQDVLKELDEDEKQLMTQTFENTVKNAKAVEIKTGEFKGNKKINSKKNSKINKNNSENIKSDVNSDDKNEENEDEQLQTSQKKKSVSINIEKNVVHILD